MTRALQPLPEFKVALPQTITEVTQETLALTKRLFIQLYRRPSTLIAGLVQPLMWLVLFGALFQNAPDIFLGEGIRYGQFVGAGIIVFTAFGGALNAGLPVMFDREFGFLNRLLVAPLASRMSIVFASALFIVSMSLVQTISIVALNAVLGNALPGISALTLVLSIIALVVVAVTSISLGLAFALKGHIELLAVIFVTNLPLLFASTALAPLSFMPAWLQTIACLNPLSWAIESIRYVYLNPTWDWSSIVMQAPWGNISMGACLSMLVCLDALVLLAIRPLLQRRLG
ncbi:ABC transporter permease [filamentous cyanobacterium LEGE 11480]|uniref:Transport permease protein n=1 Tax=Romeriopsis navalis LEGE 11480 TaxID=2777977 RepID=A0A928VIJ0_9CYAN|nr:ABC transporter permease [Romeriopsis navalis]MBE9028965.1 ABC transporter permease [Romeriopsis navalis LEGE 11480]